MAEKSRSLSYAQEAAEKGSIFSMWTKTWGLHIYPWYDKDKLKFSFVEVGKAGKGNSFDIYMDTIKYGAPCFIKWARDILSPTRRFEGILAQEAKQGEKYPKAYKYVTGNKGNKSIGFMNSTSGGYCLNASVKEGESSKYANIPLSFSDIELIAWVFMETYQSRLDELNNIRNEYIKAHASHSKDAFNDEYDQREEASTSQTAPEKPEPTIVTSTFTFPQKGDGAFIFEGTNPDVKLIAPNELFGGEQKQMWFDLSAILKEGPREVSFKVDSGKILTIEKF